MKKLIIIGVILTMCISLLSSVTACNYIRESKIQSIEEKLELEGPHGISVIVDPDFPEYEKWVGALEKTFSLLPQEVSTKIVHKFDANGRTLPLTIELRIDSPQSLGKGNKNPVIEYSYWWGMYDHDNSICIFHGIWHDPLPQPPFKLEAIALHESRFRTELGIMCHFLHELGHSWDHITLDLQASDSEEYQEMVEKEQGPSLYAYELEGFVYPTDKHVLMYFYIKNSGDEYKWTSRKINRNSPAIMKIHGDLRVIDKQEDFAECFAMYVLFPEYLKQNFPLRYNWFKNNVFLREYNQDFPIPDWAIIRKFTVPYP